MSTDTAPVAVVIVAWNAERYLVDCLESLRGLERRPAEIVVVDNASGDGTAELVRRDYPEAELLRQVTLTKLGGRRKTTRYCLT